MWPDDGVRIALISFHRLIRILNRIAPYCNLCPFLLERVDDGKRAKEETDLICVGGDR